jgi:hypothetical protein
MQIKTVMVHYERKFNLGNFESATIACSPWARLDYDDDLDECMKALWQMAKDNVKAQAMPLKAKQGAEIQEIFLGLPVELQRKFEHIDGRVVDRETGEILDYEQPEEPIMEEA